MAALSFLLAFVLILPVVVSVSAAVTTNSTSYDAGYFIETKCALNSAGCPGTTLKVDATWNLPTVSCTESGEVIYLSVGVAYEYGTTSAGSTLVVTCSGTIASYHLSADHGSAGDDITAKPFSPGDKMETIGTVVPSTGTYSVEIKDITKMWNTGTLTMTEAVVTTNRGGAVFLICGTPAPGGCAGSTTTPLPKFTTIKFTNVKLTIGGHTGSPGSIVSTSGIATTKEIWVNLKPGGTGDTVAKPSSLSSTSTGVSIKWVQGL